MNKKEFVNTDVFKETTRHALQHLVDDTMDATPPNSHVTLALVAGLQITTLGEEILMTLADYLQRHPAVSELLWEECLRDVVQR